MKWIIFGVIFLIVACVAVEIFVLQWLWNWLVPLFWASAPILTFWQAFGILALLNIIGGVLFKSSK